MNKNQLIQSGGFAIVFAVFAATFLGCLFVLLQMIRNTSGALPVVFHQ